MKLPEYATSCDIGKLTAAFVVIKDTSCTSNVKNLAKKANILKLIDDLSNDLRNEIEVQHFDPKY